MAKKTTKQGVKKPKGSSATSKAGVPNRVRKPSPSLDVDEEEVEPTVTELIAIWSKAVDTQMHFNEMSAKSRQLGLTFVAAALGVGVVLMGNQKDFSLQARICGNDVIIHVTVLLILAALLALIGVRKLDLGVYHRMLRGAVAFGEDFEESVLRPRAFKLNKGMTEAISHFSRHDNAKGTGTPRNYTGSGHKAAEKKIKSFYNITMTFLVIASFSIFIFTNLQSEDEEKTSRKILFEISE
jgi:hypothetical protein